jgi:parallel beta helix pectate lyase-like protein
MQRLNLSIPSVLFIILYAYTIHADTIIVNNSSELRRALQNAQPGDTVSIAPGNYRGGIHLSNISGTRNKRIVIQGRDPKNPPLFTGGSQALHLANCNYITLRNIQVKGFPTNGINIDDGGSFATPAHHIIVEDVTILETGPTGNLDALKMSGVDQFIIRRCRFEGWGGSGIDMVGCHHGVIEDCTFVGRKGFSQSNAVQIKGGSTDILVQTSLFKNAGQRSINLGGSTGLQFFRPKVGNFEAKKITIAGNRFLGSMAPVAWVTADGGHVHHNTIILPEKWILRILQETKDPRFLPCHDGLFENNLIIFNANVRTFVNIGPNTNPQSFTFRRNAWLDLAGQRQPNLPTPDTDSIYQPKILWDRPDLEKATIKSQDKRLKTIGADAYKKPKEKSLSF